eukprot:360124-Chlamydomonas_euryale.AAC.10
MSLEHRTHGMSLAHEKHGSHGMSLAHRTHGMSLAHEKHGSHGMSLAPGPAELVRLEASSFQVQYKEYIKSM